MAFYQINCGDYQDLALLEIGDQKCSPLYSFGPFIRNEYIFHYVISGKGYISLRETETVRTQEYTNTTPTPLDNFIPVKAGEGFLIEPHLKHVYYADEKDPWHYIWVVFKGLSVPQYLRKCGLSRTQWVYYPKDYSIQTSQKIRQHLFSIMENTGKESASIIGHFSLFFASLIENASPYAQNENPRLHNNRALSDFYLNQAIQFINLNYGTIHSLDEIADFCHISRSHLGRLFRTQLYVSLQDYLSQFRLNKACELLSTTTSSVNEIAVLSGYQNELNMLRAFKKAYGVSPTIWRSQNTL